MSFRLTVVLSLLILVGTGCQKELPQPGNPAIERTRIVNEVTNQIAIAKQEELKFALLTNRIPADAVEYHFWDLGL